MMRRNVVIGEIRGRSHRIIHWFVHRSEALVEVCVKIGEKEVSIISGLRVVLEDRITNLSEFLMHSNLERVEHSLHLFHGDSGARRGFGRWIGR